MNSGTNAAQFNARSWAMIGKADCKIGIELYFGLIYIPTSFVQKASKQTFVKTP
jgi:hypothetical protein